MYATCTDIARYCFSLLFKLYFCVTVAREEREKSPERERGERKRDRSRDRGSRRRKSRSRSRSRDKDKRRERDSHRLVDSFLVMLRNLVQPSFIRIMRIHCGVSSRFRNTVFCPAMAESWPRKVQSFLS